MKGKSLALQVKDFLPRALAQNANDAQIEIVIPYLKLAEYLDKAEDNHQRIPELLEPGVIKKTREWTPPEELGSEDEEFYQQKESKEEKRAKADVGW